MSDDDEERKPIQEVLGPVAIHPLQDGWTPLEAFVVIKALDEEGHPTWCYRTTHPPNREEVLGALTIQADLLRKEILDEWSDRDE